MSRQSMDAATYEMLVELYPQDVPSIPDTEAGFQKWLQWLVGNKVIRQADAIVCEVMFRAGTIRFKGKLRSEIL